MSSSTEPDPGASLTMVLPRDRLTRENLPDLTSMVKDHALKISHELGYKEKQKNP